MANTIYAIEKKDEERKKIIKCVCEKFETEKINYTKKSRKEENNFMDGGNKFISQMLMTFGR